MFGATSVQQARMQASQRGFATTLEDDISRLNNRSVEMQRQLDDIQKTLDLMSFMEKLHSPKKMSQWLMELGLDNFEVVKILDQINKKRQEKKK